MHIKMCLKTTSTFITQMGPSSCPILRKCVRPFLVHNIRIGLWDLTNFILHKFVAICTNMNIRLLYNISLIISKEKYHASKYMMWIEYTKWIEHKITSENDRGPLACIWLPASRYKSHDVLPLVCLQVTTL